MSKIKTYRGTLPIGEQEKIHLSTNNGLTGYRIKKFQIISTTPSITTSEFISQIFLTDQDWSITTTVDFSDSDLLAVAHLENVNTASALHSNATTIIFDNQTFNQDIFINITDAAGATTPCNYYLELEQFKLDINSATYHTLKNIRSKTSIQWVNNII